MKQKKMKIKKYTCKICGVVYLDKEQYDKHIIQCEINKEIKERYGRDFCLDCEL